MSAKLVKPSLWCFCFWFYLINLKVYMFLYFSRQWVLFCNGVKNVWLWVFCLYEESWRRLTYSVWILFLRAFIHLFFLQSFLSLVIRMVLYMRRISRVFLQIIFVNLMIFW